MESRSLAIILASSLTVQLPTSGKTAVSSGSRLGQSAGIVTRAPFSGKTAILVVGTIHQRHETNKNYSYADVIRILSTYDPDLICVEIRPKDFRKVPYLKEMMLATIWGFSHGTDVAPIDWWEDAPNDREVRGKLAKQPEYVEKEKQEEALCAQSPIITRYENKYGPAEKENTWGKNLGYEFWNGQDYNEYYAEIYRISMKVYGDSPFNLHYQTRNDRMMQLIEKAIRDHHSHRVIVLTGSEHKHFFDREFRKTAGFATLDFEGLLPLEEVKLEPTILRFLDEDDDSPYYEKGYPADPDANFHNKLTPIVHGPDMDVFPDTIPQSNIVRAGKILNRWKALRPESDTLTHEQAWMDFLRGNYAQAVQEYLGLAKKIDRRQVTDAWIRFDSYLNLGRCYDVLGERKKALECYARCEELIAGTRWERAKDYILQNYREVPYKRAEPRKGAN
jgi:tetratricopeptide (TPR) repeat protein